MPLCYWISKVMGCLSIIALPFRHTCRQALVSEARPACSYLYGLCCSVSSTALFILTPRIEQHSAWQTHQESRLVCLHPLCQRLLNVNGPTDSVLCGTQGELNLKRICERYCMLVTDRTSGCEQPLQGAVTASERTLDMQEYSTGVQILSDKHVALILSCGNLVRQD